MRITVSSTVTKPAEQLFWLSQDYERRLEWDIYLAEAYLLEGRATAAVGVESYCKSKGGSVLISKYISFSPPSHAAVRMTQGPWILRKFGGTWRFIGLEEGRTEVRFVYNFQVRPAFLRWLVEPLVAAVYRRDMQRRINAFTAWAQHSSQKE